MGRKVFSAAAVLSFALAFQSLAAVTYTDLYTIKLPTDGSILHFGPYLLLSGGQVVGGLQIQNQITHALLWDNRGDATQIHPDGFGYSFANSTDGIHQVGYGGPVNGNTAHALMWSGTKAAVDLHPAAFAASYAFSVSGGQEVGYGDLADGTQHALLWNGSNAAIDLHPDGYAKSTARGTDGSNQVGYGVLTDKTIHALIWHGSNVATELPASAYRNVVAENLADGQAVGEGSAAAGFEHALLWNGNDPAIDLHPGPAFLLSRGYGVGGGYQVGNGYNNFDSAIHALLWHGSAESMIDLQSVLPASFKSSTAVSIVGSNVYGLALDNTGREHLIVWTIPEPGSLAVFAMAGAVASLRRRREFDID